MLGDVTPLKEFLGLRCGFSGFSVTYTADIVTKLLPVYTNPLTLVDLHLRILSSSIKKWRVSKWRSDVEWHFCWIAPTMRGMNVILKRWISLIKFKKEPCKPYTNNLMLPLETQPAVKPPRGCQLPFNGWPGTALLSQNLWLPFQVQLSS